MTSAARTPATASHDLLFLAQDGTLRGFPDLAAAMRALSADLRAAAAAGVVEDAQTALGLAAVVEHAARSFAAAIGEEIDLDGV